MRKIILISLFCLGSVSALLAESSVPEKEIYSLIADYARARETKDEALLKRVLTVDADQLVSSGEWRIGMTESVTGMMRSSQSNPGERSITVERVRFLNSESAIADARYEIRNADGTGRNMWTTFVVVLKDGMWKISAIRNMLPAAQQ